MELAFEILYSDIEIASNLGEASDSATIPQLHRDKLIAGNGVRAGFEQRFSDFFHCHPGSNIGEIRTDGFSSAVHHVAGSAFSFPEEESLSGNGIADGDALSSRRV